MRTRDVEPGMRRTLATILLVGSLVLAGCGDDDSTEADDPAAGSGGADAAAAAPACIGADEELLDEYVGLSEDEVAELAEEQGLQVREVGRDGECAVVTMDLRDDRVNVEYVDDVVVAAAVF